ncbi:A1 cistron-splicing factor AAR2, partial [Clonorchis sinensis]
AVNADCKSGQRTGFVEWFTHPGFVAKRWVAVDEDFVDVPLTPSDVQRLTDNYEEVSLYLGPYPSECRRGWVALTNLISPASLSRILPECGRVYSCTQFLSEPSSSQQRLALQPAAEVSSNPEDLLPKLQILPGTEIRFSKIPKNPLFPPNSNPTEITAHGIDQTYTLDSVLRVIADSATNLGPADVEVNQPDCGNSLLPEERELLAELQFSYVTFLLIHVLDGWYQWRRIVQLLANCEEAIYRRPQLYINLVSVLYHQLCSAAKSKEFLEDKTAAISTAELADLFFSETTGPRTNLAEPAFLPSVVRKLLRNILCTPTLDSGNGLLQSLRERAEGFCHSLEQRFHLGIKPEVLKKEKNTADVLVDDVDWEGDEAPVIVQL